MIQNKYYGLRHDVWGLGVLSYFLFSGNFPFDGEDETNICDQILNKQPNFEILHSRGIDSKIIQLIEGMLLKDPNKRLTIRKVMDNKIFKILQKDNQSSKVKFLSDFKNKEY